MPIDLLFVEDFGAVWFFLVVMVYGGPFNSGFRPYFQMNMASMLSPMQAPFRNQFPPLERPTLLYQKAIPRNLADCRSIREFENGTSLEFGEKKEILMLALDEEYFGAQKLLNVDRVVSMFMFADPSLKDELLEFTRSLQSFIDGIVLDTDYYRDIIVAVSRVNKSHGVCPKSLLDQLRVEKKRRTQKAKLQLQRKLKHMDADDEAIVGIRALDEEDDDVLVVLGDHVTSDDMVDVNLVVRPPRRRINIVSKKNGEGRAGTLASVASSSLVPSIGTSSALVPCIASLDAGVSTRSRSQLSFDRLVGLPAKKKSEEIGLMIDGVCAGGCVKDGDVFLKFSWDGEIALEDVLKESAVDMLKVADKRNLLDSILSQFTAISIATPQGREKLRRVDGADL